MRWLVEKPIAHRGLHNGKEIPENSLLAFNEALRYGYPVEFDVRLLADGNLAVFHDESLSRMTGQPGLIFEKTVSQLAGIRLLEGDQKIPLVSEVLSLVKGQVPLLIEIKNNNRVGPLEKRLWEFLKDYRGELAIQSFNPFSVGWFRLNNPSVIRGQLSGDFRDENLAFYRKFLLGNLFLNRVSSPHFIAYDIRCLPCPPVERVRSRGLPILGWVAKNRMDFEKALRFCDNVIFEGFRP